MRVLLVLLVGCGRIGFDASTTDAGTSDSSTSDSAEGAFHCARWSTPMRVGDLSTDDYDYETALHPTLPLVVISSNRDTDPVFHLYASVGEDLAWMTPVAIDTGGLPGDTDTGPEWASHGRTLYFSTARSSVARLYTMTFDGTNFGPPVLIPEITEQALGIAVRFDELEMFYTAAVIPQRIRRASRATTSDPWIPDADYIFSGTSDYQGWASMTSDGLEIYFEVGTQSDENIYRSTRDSPNASWTTPTLVAELRTDESDGDPEVSADGRTLLLSSDRATQGDPDIYRSTCEMPR